MLHRYWTSDNLYEQHALLAYQEEQRRAWHQTIPQPNGAWNTSIIDEVEMSRVFDRVYHAERERADSDFDFKFDYVFDLVICLKFLRLALCDMRYAICDM